MMNDNNPNTMDTITFHTPSPTNQDSRWYEVLSPTQVRTEPEQKSFLDNHQAQPQQEKKEKKQVMVMEKYNIDEEDHVVHNKERIPRPTTISQNPFGCDQDSRFHSVHLLENVNREQQQQQKCQIEWRKDQQEREHQLFESKWRQQQFDTEFRRARQKNYEENMRWLHGSLRRRSANEYDEQGELDYMLEEELCEQLEQLERQEDEQRVQREQQEQQQVEESEQYEHGQQLEYMKQLELLTQQQVKHD